MNLLKVAFKRLIEDSEYTAKLPNRRVPKSDLRRFLVEGRKLHELVRNKGLVSDFIDLDLDIREDLLDTAFPADYISLSSSGNQQSASFISERGRQLGRDIKKCLAFGSGNLSSRVKPVLRKYGVNVLRNAVTEQYEVKGGTNKVIGLTCFLLDSRDTFNIVIDEHVGNVSVGSI